MKRPSTRRPRPGSIASPLLGFPIFARPALNLPEASPPIPQSAHPRLRGGERKKEPASPAKAGALSHAVRDAAVAWTPASAGEAVWVDWVNLND
jgi:hypothetical protein